MKILFLVIMMSRGMGVSVVVHEISQRLKNIGASVYIGCLSNDGFFSGGEKTLLMEADADIIQAFIDENEIDFVIAHTSPYFEVLPLLTSREKCLVWEHGEPTPFFFSGEKYVDDEKSREKRALYKEKNVYSNVAQVISISEFIKNDIHFLESVLIYNGCDHVKDYGCKIRQKFFLQDNLRVGTLMRLGIGESAYKGNEIFIELAEYFHKNFDNFVFEVMGKGTEEDAKKIREKGIKVHLNASDEERSTFLRELDIFVSCSLWEGFNLPVVEAQASGTVGLAFDVGSHPEVTPFLCRNIYDMESLIIKYMHDRELLFLHSKLAYSYVRNKFCWDKTVQCLLKVLYDLKLKTNKQNNILLKFENKKILLKFKHKKLYKKIFDYYKKNGFKETIKKFYQKILMHKV